MEMLRDLLNIRQSFSTALASLFSDLRMILLLPAVMAAALALATLNLSFSPARAEQARLPSGEICACHIAEAEKKLDIPSQLFLAIAMVKSGVWDRERACYIAWPWTVYAQKNGRHFTSKAEALTDIRETYNQGVRNIDVGCMQISLQYHGQAFGSLEELLDPAYNVAYDALSLKSLYRDARSWSTATARYHSSTPTLARACRDKVKQAWAAAPASGPCSQSYRMPLTQPSGGTDSAIHHQAGKPRLHYAELNDQEIVDECLGI